jgi:hypothetical protein
VTASLSISSSLQEGFNSSELPAERGRGDRHLRPRRSDRGSRRWDRRRHADRMLQEAYDKGREQKGQVEDDIALGKERAS